jgi:hypothetical protein
LPAGRIAALGATPDLHHELEFRSNVNAASPRGRQRKTSLVLPFDSGSVATAVWLDGHASFRKNFSGRKTYFA